MSCFRILCLVLMGGFCSFACCEDNTIKISENATLFDTGPRWQLSVDLGKLIAGTKYDIDLQIRNAMGRDVEFNSVTTSCSCTRASLEEGVLPAEQQLGLKLLLDPMAKAAKPDGSTKVTLVNESNPAKNLLITFQYQLKGLLEFPAKMFVFEIGDESLSKSGNHHVRLPLYVTNPIARENILITTGAEGISATIEGDKSDPDKDFVVLAIAPDKLRDRGVSTEIRVEDLASGRKAKTAVIIRPKPFARISPTVTRFRRNGANDLKSSSILVIEEPKSDSQSEPPSPIVDATISGNRLKVRIEKVSNKLYRLHIVNSANYLAKAMEDSENATIVWSIRSASGSETQQTKVSVVDTVLKGAKLK